MKHLLRGREVTVAVVSGVAATLVAGAVGLSAVHAEDPAPIELDVGAFEPVAPVPLQDVEPAAAEPSIVSPAEAELTEPGTTASPASPPSAPSPVTPVSAASPASAPSPASPTSTASPAAPASPASQASPTSPASPASAGSIDS